MYRLITSMKIAIPTAITSAAGPKYSDSTYPSAP